MKIIALPIAVAFTLFLSPPGFAETDSLPTAMQSCANMTVCEQTAVKQPFPGAGNNLEVAVGGGHFSFFPPDAVTDVAVGWGESPNYVIRLKGGKLMASEERLVRLDNTGLCSANESPAPTLARFLFLQTAKEKEPDDKCQQTIFRLAFFQKSSSIFKDAQHLVWFEKNNLEIYLANVSGIDHDTYAMVTHRDKPFHYLVIRTQGVDRERLLKTLATIKIKP
ncbi:MAG: hypothetical protein OEZ43_11490 [Gammaproteobacteria bacterium]|nr:hypothetical protein [Gammaproteobacteria bacterium]